MNDLDSPVRANRHRNVVCVYSRGPRVTHYLGLDATQLCCLQKHNDEFDREFDKPLHYTAADFAARYTKDKTAMKMIPLTGTAMRVLAAILKGQSTPAVSHLNHLESKMSEAATFRKPDGPVAMVHAYLDKRLEQIKAGKISRKELIDALVAKEMSAGTVTTQCGRWAKTNGVTFTRPVQAAVVKKAAAKAARTKKKAEATA